MVTTFIRDNAELRVLWNDVKATRLIFGILVRDTFCDVNRVDSIFMSKHSAYRLLNALDHMGLVHSEGVEQGIYHIGATESEQHDLLRDTATNRAAHYSVVCTMILTSLRESIALTDDIGVTDRWLHDELSPHNANETLVRLATISLWLQGKIRMTGYDATHVDPLCWINWSHSTQASIDADLAWREAPYDASLRGGGNFDGAKIYHHTAGPEALAETESTEAVKSHLEELHKLTLREVLGNQSWLVGMAVVELTMGHGDTEDRLAQLHNALDCITSEIARLEKKGKS